MSRELRIEGTSHDCNYSNKNGKSILGELAKYHFSDAINAKANIIYGQMNNATCRANNRPCLLFHCVYNAHKDLGLPVNVSDLGKIFGLTQGQIQKTNSKFSPNNTGYKPTYREISALHFLPGFCEQLGITEYTEDIMDYAKNILDKNPALIQLVAQTVAAGLLKYYLTINGIVLEDDKQMAIVTSRSDTTIDSMSKTIAECDT
jgi:hypothetical protein